MNTEKKEIEEMRRESGRILIIQREASERKWNFTSQLWLSDYEVYTPKMYNLLFKKIDIQGLILLGIIIGVVLGFILL